MNWSPKRWLVSLCAATFVIVGVPASAHSLPISPSWGGEKTEHIEVQPLSPEEAYISVEQAKEMTETFQGGDAKEGMVILRQLQSAQDPWLEVESLSDSEGRDLIAALEQNPTETIDPRDKVSLQSDSFYQFWASSAEKTACYLQFRATICNQAADLAAKAQRDAERNFSGQMHNGGPGDAFRHCWWSASMTTDISENVAAVIGTNHETYGTGNSPADTQMDLYNNAQGRWAAVASGYNWQGAVALCQQWARNGVLRVNVP